MAQKSDGGRTLRIVVEVILCLMIAIILVGFVQQFFLAPVSVEGASMLDTFNEKGDRVYVQKKFFKVSDGDIVVFYRPNRDDVSTKNPANSISFSDFFNSLPFVNKIPRLVDDDQKDTGADYTCVIKRVVGVAGDHIEIKLNEEGTATMLYRNGKLVTDGRSYNMPVNLNLWDITLKEGELFVLGDNRGNSYDSEDYGPIQTSWLMGKVVLAKVGGDFISAKKLK